MYYRIHCYSLTRATIKRKQPKEGTTENSISSHLLRRGTKHQSYPFSPKILNISNIHMKPLSLLQRRQIRKICKQNNKSESKWERERTKNPQNDNRRHKHQQQKSSGKKNLKRNWKNLRKKKHIIKSEMPNNNNNNHSNSSQRTTK